MATTVLKPYKPHEGKNVNSGSSRNYGGSSNIALALKERAEAINVEALAIIGEINAWKMKRMAKGLPYNNPPAHLENALALKERTVRLLKAEAQEINGYNHKPVTHAFIQPTPKFVKLVKASK